MIQTMWMRIKGGGIEARVALKLGSAQDDWIEGEETSVTHINTQHIPLWTSILRSLDIKPSIYLHSHTRHTRILDQHDERIHAVLQKRFMLETSLILDGIDYFLRVFQALHWSSAPRLSLLSWMEGRHTHSVRRRPGSTVLIRVLGPCVVARHLTS